MPWTTPTLENVRIIDRNNVQSSLNSGPMIPNSALRVMSDANASLAYLSLLYIDWLSRQLLPDTAEEQWLDRHAAIWLPGNGRKPATYATGTMTFTSISSIVLPAGAILSGATDLTSGANINFSTASQVTVGVSPTPVTVNALTPGATGEAVGSTLGLVSGVAGINPVGTFTAFTDGVEQESDDSLRARVLARIQQPPVGGDAQDWVEWATNTPGVPVTRAWCSPLEMGAGTVTVRFMCDNVSVSPPVPGFPTAAQITAVQNYVDTLRPVAVKDRFIVSPVPEPINLIISNLSPDNVANRNAIAAAISNMLFERAAPAHAINGVEHSAQTIYAAWVSDAISSVSTVNSFTLTMSDHPMPFPGSMGVLGSVVYA